MKQVTRGVKLIALARKEIGFLPSEMARAMGVSWSTYKKWASGANPLPPVAERLLYFMRVHPETARTALAIANAVIADLEARK